jgi:hypothetical protein
LKSHYKIEVSISEKIIRPSPKSNTPTEASPPLKEEDLGGGQKVQQNLLHRDVFSLRDFSFCLDGSFGMLSRNKRIKLIPRLRGAVR